MLEPGIKKFESAGADWSSVSFQDDMGQELRIECSRLSPEDKRAMAKVEPRKGFDAVFQGEVMRRFQAVSNQTEIWDEEMLDTTAGKTFFAAVLIPGGSTLVRMQSGQPPTHPDSFRGVFLFIEGDFLYVMMDQEPPPFDLSTPEPREQRIARRREDLQKSLANMTFR